MLKLLDPVHHAAIRLCTGAYRTSPVESLYAESGEPSLEKRRMQLILQYYGRTLQLESAASFSYVNAEAVDSNVRPGHVSTVNERIVTAISSLNLEISTMPFCFPSRPVWQVSPQLLCTEYSYPKKDNCSPQHMRMLFRDHCDHFHKNQFAIYTDGARNENGVGASAVSLRGGKKMKLRKESSIFTAELCGVLCALQIAAATYQRQFVIFCDSQSVLKVLEHYESTNPLVSKIVRWLIKLKDKSIKFCWCPSHVGIVGNEMADKEATIASYSNMPASNSHVPYRDWYPIIRAAIKQLWESEWSQIEYNKLRQIKHSVDTWKTSISDRKNSIITARLRIGHTRLTHQYLLEGRGQPYCEDCLVPLTVKHFLAECPSHSDTRELLYPEIRERSVEEALREVLTEKSNCRFDSELLMTFLRNLGLHREIV